MLFAGALVCCLTSGREATAQTLQDYFTNRTTITSASGEIHANNNNATLEAGEPELCGKPGGHSLWITWIAPTNGIVQFETHGSGFDTLLAAYYFADTNDTEFSQLIEITCADDSEGFGRESEIQFGVLAGQCYEIAMDGYRGATGRMELEWEFKPTPAPPPVVVSTPQDQAVNLGDPLDFRVALINAANGQYQWYFNGSSLGVSGTNLHIASVQSTDVGRYRLRIKAGGEEYFTSPTELQINTDGITNALAQSKVLDSSSTPIIGSSGGSELVAKAYQPKGGNVGVVRGYNGSQIFNTVYGTVDPAEPPHCGMTNGISYWLTYQPPENGTIALDTTGSTYDTVMEVYTYDAPLTGYQDLISLDCNNDVSESDTTSSITLPVIKTRPYLIVVSGANGSTGTARLNYSLNTNQLPQAPQLLVTPVPQVVAVGRNVMLKPSVIGTAPLKFSWQKDLMELPGNAPLLVLANVTTNDTANYTVTITNELGSASATLPLRVLEPAVATIAPSLDGLMLRFSTESGRHYVIESASNLAGPWQAWPNFYVGDGQPVTAYVSNQGTRYYRVRTE